MAKDPAFLFYPGDWLGGTMAMSFEDKGIYISLLMLQFNNGHMTKDMMGQYIGHMFGQFWDKHSSKFGQDENGLYYNKKLDAEKDRRKSFVDSRFNNKTGKNQFSEVDKPDGHTTTHMSKHMENENIIGIKEGVETIKRSFEIFWNLYEKKIGKPKSLNEWKKLTPEEQAAALKYIPAYKLIKEKQFRKDPERFLRNKCWNDELVSPEAKINGEVKHTQYIGMKPSEFWNTEIKDTK